MRTTRGRGRWGILIQDIRELERSSPFVKGGSGQTLGSSTRSFPAIIPSPACWVLWQPAWPAPGGLHRAPRGSPPAPRGRQPLGAVLFEHSASTPKSRAPAFQRVTRGIRGATSAEGSLEPCQRVPHVSPQPQPSSFVCFPPRPQGAGSQRQLRELFQKGTGFSLQQQLEVGTGLAGGRSRAPSSRLCAGLGEEGEANPQRWDSRGAPATAPVIFLPLSIIRQRSTLEQCDYLPGLGREAGLTCLESPDAAIYRVNVFQGFRGENTLLKHPRSFSASTGIPTIHSALARLLRRSPDTV